MQKCFFKTLFSELIQRRTELIRCCIKKAVLNRMRLSESIFNYYAAECG